MKNINLPICQKCINFKKKVCLGECPPIQWINGNKQRQEPLVRDILSENLTNDKNYNEVISELAEDRREKLSRALAIPNERNRAIAILLLAGYKQVEISNYFHLSIKQIQRISK